MTPSLAIAVLALAVSVVSFVVNRRAADRAERHGRMPVLIPRVWDQQEGCIAVRNIGSGPALNVTIAHPLDELIDRDALGIDLTKARYRAMWDGFMHLQPLESGAECAYEWDYRRGIGLTCTDALGTYYTTLATTYGTKVVDGRAMPIRRFTELEYPEFCLDEGGQPL